MAKTIVEKAPVIDALAAQWATIDELVSPLTDEQWHADSGLPGWTIADVVAHIVGTEMMLDGQTVEATRDVAALDYVKNSIGELNENWLDHFRPQPREAVMAAYRDITAKRIADLAAMSDDAWDAETFTPAGPDTMGRFMRIRIYDSWVHEMDIRDALDLGEPTDPLPAELALVEMAAVLPYLVGKKAKAPEGSTVTFHFTGLAPLQVHLDVTGRATIVPSLPTTADVTLKLSVIDYARLAGDRPKAGTATVHIDGDVALGAAIVENLHYMI